MKYVHIAGRLAKDAEVRFTNNSLKVTTLVLPVNSKKGGTEETTWFRVSLWGDRWDKLAPHLKKGTGVIVGGELKKPEIYTDKSGVPQVGSLEVRADFVHFAPGSKEEGMGGSSGGFSQAGSDHGAGNPFEFEGAYMGGGSIQDEPLPF